MIAAAQPNDPADESAAPPDDAPSIWSTIVWFAASVVLVVIVVGLWHALRSGGEGSDIAQAIVQGDRPVAPAIPTTGIAGDGAPGYGPAAAKGQVVVVNFWASWCGPCKDEAPVLQRVAEEFEGRVVVVGFNAGSEDLEPDARQFVRDHDLTFPIVRGDRKAVRAWGVRGYPQTFIVGVDGRLSAHVNGPVDRDTLHELLDDELARERRP